MIARASSSGTAVGKAIRPLDENSATKKNRAVRIRAALNVVPLIKK
jgi:hypothetical protein